MRWADAGSLHQPKLKVKGVGDKLDGRLNVEDMTMEVRREDRLHLCYLACVETGRLVVERYRVATDGPRLVDRAEKVVAGRG